MNRGIKRILFCSGSFFFLVGSENIQFNLVTTYFDRQDRIHEFHRCFQENIRNPYIKRIYVLYEDFQGNAPWFLLHDKIKIIKLDHYPIHKDFYDFINNNLNGELVMWANTDIYFDETLKSLRHVNFDEAAVILTRYQVPSYIGKWKRHRSSHDVWIFKSPIKYLNGDIKINRFGNEAFILHELLRCWPKVINPSLTVKAWHEHLDDYRAAIVTAGYRDYPPSAIVPFSALPD